MKIDISVNSLIIEVTRRCNMHCNHCLRGDAQNCDISTESIKKIAQTIQPGSVTFTGGEPSLNVKAIREYFAYAEKFGTMPSSFFVATNGLSNQEELAVELLKAYGKMDEKECCELALSRDIFHDAYWDDSKSYDKTIFEGLSFFRKEDKAHATDGSDSLDWVMPIGRAADNGMGNESNFVDIPITSLEYLCQTADHSFIESEDTLDLRFDTIYISANGNVTTICDISYKDIDNLYLATIDDFVENVTAYINEHEEEFV